VSLGDLSLRFAWASKWLLGEQSPFTIVAAPKRIERNAILLNDDNLNNGEWANRLDALANRTGGWANAAAWDHENGDWGLAERLCGRTQNLRPECKRTHTLASECKKAFGCKPRCGERMQPTA